MDNKKISNIKEKTFQKDNIGIKQNSSSGNTNTSMGFQALENNTT